MPCDSVAVFPAMMKSDSVPTVGAERCWTIVVLFSDVSDAPVIVVVGVISAK